MIYRGEVLGVINVRTEKEHEYTQTQVRLLQSIASQISGAIENSRQYRKLEKRASQLSTLSEVSKTITSDLYLEEILQLIVAATADTLSFKVCSLMLLDEDKQELVVKATQSKSREYAKKSSIKVGESIAGRALAEGQAITVYDLKNSTEYATPELGPAGGPVVHGLYTPAGQKQENRRFELLHGEAAPVHRRRNLGAVRTGQPCGHRH